MQNLYFVFWKISAPSIGKDLPSDFKSYNFMRLLIDFKSWDKFTRAQESIPMNRFRQDGIRFLGSFKCLQIRAQMNRFIEGL